MTIKLIKRYLFTIVITLLLIPQANAQLSKIRQLQHDLPQLKDSIAYVDALNDLGLLYYFKSWDSCLLYAQEARDISNRLHYQRGLAVSLNVQAVYHISENSYLATKYLDESLQLFQKLHDTAYIAMLYNNLALIFYFENNLDSTVAYFRHAIELTQHQTNDSIRAGFISNLAETDNSLTPHQRDSMFNLAMSIAQRHNDEQMVNYLKMCKLTRSFKQQKGNTNTDSLLSIFDKMEQAGNNYNLADAYTTFANSLAAKGDTALAVIYYNKALDKAIANNSYPMRAMVLESLMRYYASVNNTSKAYEYAQLLLEEKNKLNERLKNSGYTFANFITNENNLELAETRAAEQRKITFFSILLMVITLILLAVLFKSYRISRRAHAIQQQLTDSTLQRNAQLEAWDQFNTMLLGIMAHDLRQPFATLISATEATRMGIDLSAEQYSFIINDLRETALQSIQFIEGLLCWVKSKREDFAYRPISVPLQDAINQANTFFVSDQQKKKINLNTVVEPNSLTISADKTMLLFILRNLLNNATKYSPKGGHITIAAARQNHAVTISVADQGKGMSPETLQKLFSPEKNNSMQTDTLQGAGLALVISHDMVKQMHGKLTAESEEGTGTVFHLELPVPGEN